MRKLWFAFAVGLIGVVSVAALTSPEPEQVSARGSRALRGGPAGVVKTTGAHWIQVDHHTGLVWFSDTWAMALGRLDPRTGDIQMANTGLHGNVALSSDGLSIWRTHRGSILQYDTKTVMETGTPIREIKLTGVNSTYGNFVSHDGAYFGGGGSHIVWMDIETGEVRQVRLTAGGRGRGSFDADGNIWVGGRKLAKYDPRTGALEEYAPPSPHVNLYSAEADRNGDIWLGQQQAGRVARFNPDTHQWIEYVLPSPWSFVFNSWIDNSTDTPTFWYGDQHGHIVRIQPLPDAAGAPEPARGAPAPTGPARPLPPVDEFDRNARLWAMQRTGHESGWQRGQEIYFMRCWMCHNEYTIAADPVAAPSLRDLYTRATLAVGVQTIVDHVRPRNKRDFAARGGGPHEQGEVSRESGARHPAEDAAPVLSRRKDPDRSRGAARRREHCDALSPRGPEPESLLPVEQGVPRSREETARGGYDPRSDVE